MSKQTAVDVYHDQIKYLIKMGLKLSEPDKTLLNSAYRDCKAMEREQIIEIVEKSRATGLTAEYLILTYKGGEHDA